MFAPRGGGSGTYPLTPTRVYTNPLISKSANLRKWMIAAVAAVIFVAIAAVVALTRFDGSNDTNQVVTSSTGTGDTIKCSGIVGN